MSEQAPHGSNNSQRPEPKAQDPLEGGPYRPDSRADVGPKPLVARKRKYADKKKLRKKNAQGILQYSVSIVSARYDDVRHKWMYTLNDWQNERITGETEEKELG